MIDNRERNKQNCNAEARGSRTRSCEEEVQPKRLKTPIDPCLKTRQNELYNNLSSACTATFITFELFLLSYWIKFWHDSWCGDLPLRVQFPDLFRLACAPEASVADHLCFQGSIRHWDIAFCRRVHDWELETVAAFMDLLYSCSIRQGNLDSLCWRPASKQIFQVRSYYSVLLKPSRISFPWRSVWKAKVPSRVAFFSWTATLGRILTTDNLRKRKVLIIDWCCMCKTNGESVNHLLLHCPIAQDLWNLVFILFGISWVMPRGVEELFECWSGKKEIQNLKLFGRQSLIASCGAYGEREIPDLFLGRSSQFPCLNSHS